MWAFFIDAFMIWGHTDDPDRRLSVSSAPGSIGVRFASVPKKKSGPSPIDPLSKKENYSCVVVSADVLNFG